MQLPTQRSSLICQQSTSASWSLISCLSTHFNAVLGRCTLRSDFNPLASQLMASMNATLHLVLLVWSCNRVLCSPEFSDSQVTSTGFRSFQYNFALLDWEWDERYIWTHYTGSFTLATEPVLRLLWLSVKIKLIAYLYSMHEKQNLAATIKKHKGKVNYILMPFIVNSFPQ